MCWRPLQIAKGLESSGNTTLVPEFNYDTVKSIAWSNRNNAWERIFTAGINITDSTTSGTAWHGSTWWVPITGFFNTFKDTKQEEQELQADTQTGVDFSEEAQLIDKDQKITAPYIEDKALSSLQEKIKEKSEFDINSLDFENNIRLYIKRALIMQNLSLSQV